MLGDRHPILRIWVAPARGESRLGRVVWPLGGAVVGVVPVLDRRGRRYARRDALSRRAPDIDYHEIYRQLATLEFPWDIYQALSFALFRTYAVPSIGEPLHRSSPAELRRAARRPLLDPRRPPRAAVTFRAAST